LNKLITAQKSVVTKLDPSGLVGADYAGAPEDELQHPAYRKLDVLGINEYFGWYPGLLGSTLNMGDLRPYLDYLHKAYSHQAMFVTEFGAEANHSGSADELGTYEFQANFMIAQMRILRNTPYLNGFFAWALKDYWVRPGWNGGNPDPTPPYSTKGLWDTNNVPKPAEAEVEREFKSTPPFR
jgi:beta-glucuronidase